MATISAGLRGKKLRLEKARREDEMKKLAPLNLAELVHPKQLAFITDPSTEKVACCTRRSGKTYGTLYYMINVAKMTAGAKIAYITLSRTSAESIVWGPLKKTLGQLGMGEHDGTNFHNTKLLATLPNGSEIRLLGAKDAVEIEKVRGNGFDLVIIDEAQSFKPFLKKMLDDIITPALFDRAGTLCVIGTPSPMLTGPFYHMYHNTPKSGFENYKKFHWTSYDNDFAPYLQKGISHDMALAEVRRKRGIDEMNPSYMREYRGLWVEDKDSLVYKFNEERNQYKTLPALIKWDYIMGWDIGFDDAHALVILAYNIHHPVVYLVEEFIETGLTISKIANEIKRLDDKYQPIKKVADTGGLGKLAVESIKEDYNIHFEAAQKGRKHEYIEFFNDALRTSRIKVLEESEAVQDWARLSWKMDSLLTGDPEEDESKIKEFSGGKKQVDSGFHSDIADAILYAWRECKVRILVDEVPLPQPGTPEYHKLERDKMREKAIKQAQNRRIPGDSMDFDQLMFDALNGDSWEDV